MMWWRLASHFAVAFHRLIARARGPAEGNTSLRPESKRSRSRWLWAIEIQDLHLKETTVTVESFPDSHKLAAVSSEIKVTATACRRSTYYCDLCQRSKSRSGIVPLTVTAGRLWQHCIGSTAFALCCRVHPLSGEFTGACKPRFTTANLLIHASLNQLFTHSNASEYFCDILIMHHSLHLKCGRVACTTVAGAEWILWDKNINVLLLCLSFQSWL